MGIMFDENDTLWATLYRRDSALYTLDPSTGVGTFVHNSRMYYPHGGDIYPIRSVVIDIKPDSVPNSVNVKSKGVIPVALLSTPEFADPSAVDVTSARFGPAGATAAHGGHIEDVNGDGNFDLVLHFKTPETGIACGLHLASDEGVTTILYLYFWRESAINLAWPMNAHMPSTTTVTNGIATTTKRSRGCGRWRRARHVNGIRCSVSTIGCNVSTIGCDVRTIG